MQNSHCLLGLVFAFFYSSLNQWSLPAVVRRNLYTDDFLKRTSCHKNHSSQHSTNENKGGSKICLVKWQKTLIQKWTKRKILLKVTRMQSWRCEDWFFTLTSEIKWFRSVLGCSSSSASECNQEWVTMVSFKQSSANPQKGIEISKSRTKNISCTLAV